MPRGQKSKLRSRKKRRQARDETQGVKDAEATAAEAKEAPSCSDSVPKDAVPSTSTAGLPQKSQEAPPATTAAVGGARRKSGKGARSRGRESTSSFTVPSSSESPQNDILARKAGMVMQYLLYKYKMKEPIMKGEMLKIVNKRFREQFPEILKKATEPLELVFGLELKEVKPNGNSYTFVSMLDLSNNERLSSGWGFPQNGLLIPLLGVILLNGNRASEEEVWKFLNMLRVYDGRKHFILGDPRKFITQDLVQEKYLEYRQVPDSDPARFEFLWGPRAIAETSKMKVLQLLSKFNDAIPSAFPSHYEEALREEEERAQAKVAASRGTVAQASPSTKAKPSRSTP